jgi:ribonuclease HI
MNPARGESRPSVTTRWVPPPEGCVKINSDGSFDCSSNQGAGAAVIRNHEGIVLAATTKWYGPIHDALVAEALAAREGLKLARQLEFSDIILESDSSILVRILNEEVPDRSLIAGIWHECRELCMSFNNVKVCYVPREGNFLADKCVKEASADAPVLVWLADVPQWLKDAAAMDCNHNLVE